MNAADIRAHVARDLGVRFSFPCFASGTGSGKGTYTRCMLETKDDVLDRCASDRVLVGGGVTSEQAQLRKEYEELVCKVILRKPAARGDTHKT